MNRFPRQLLRLPGRLWRVGSDSVTLSGKSMLVAAVVTSIGIAFLDLLLYHLFAALTALLLASFTAGMFLRPRLRLQGTFPRTATAGETITGQLHLKNRRRCGAYDLTIAFRSLPRGLEQPGGTTIVRTLPAEKSISVPVALRPLRRGLYNLPDLCVGSEFPFHLFRLGTARLPVESLLVLPTFVPLEEFLLSVGSRHQPGGVALTSHVGESPEYIGNREYQPGETARRLDYRAWARLGVPVVREYQEEYYCRVAMVLDTYIPPRRKTQATGFVELEAAISLAAAVADALSRGEYLVDVFAAGPELYVFESGRNKAHFDNILEILACLEPCRRDPFDTLGPSISEQLHRISAAVCIFLDWDEPRREMIRLMAEAGCNLKIVIVRDGPTTEPIDAAQADAVTELSTAVIQQGGPAVL